MRWNAQQLLDLSDPNPDVFRNAPRGSAQILQNQEVILSDIYLR